MKNKCFILALISLLAISCKKNELKIPQADVSVMTEIIEQSPIYITRENGKVNVNKTNVIGNTHWVLSVDRDLKMSELYSVLNELMVKKYTKEIHKDNKDVFAVYYNKTTKQAGFIPMFFKKIVALQQFDKNLIEKVYLYDISNSEQPKLDKEKLTTSSKIAIVFDRNITFETFVQQLIPLFSEESIKNKLDKTIYFK